MAHLKLNTKQWLQLGKKLGYIKMLKRAQEEIDTETELPTELPAEWDKWEGPKDIAKDPNPWPKGLKRHEMDVGGGERSDIQVSKRCMKLWKDAIKHYREKMGLYAPTHGANLQQLAWSATKKMNWLQNNVLGGTIQSFLSTLTEDRRYRKLTESDIEYELFWMIANPDRAANEINKFENYTPETDQNITLSPKEIKEEINNIKLLSPIAQKIRKTRSTQVQAFFQFKEAWNVLRNWPFALYSAFKGQCPGLLQKAIIQEEETPYDITQEERREQGRFYETTPGQEVTPSPFLNPEDEPN